MWPRRFTWRLLPLLLVLTTMVLAVLGTHLYKAVSASYVEEGDRQLAARATNIAHEMAERPAGETPPCQALGQSAGLNLTVIDRSGKVLCDSDVAPEVLADIRNRPEIQAALAGRTQAVTRYSMALGQTTRFLALPVTPDGIVIRVGMRADHLDELLTPLRMRFFATGGAILLLIGIAGFWGLRCMTQSLEEIRTGAARLADGEFDTFLRTAYPATELDGIAIAINRMARQLEERSGTVAMKQSEQNAVFSGMTEGVIALDMDGRILAMNLSAARLLEREGPDYAGRPLQEVDRNPDLLRFVEDMEHADTAAEAEIVLHGGESRTLRLYGTPLTGKSGRRTGTLLILGDITRLKKLESLRTDFVANVSHELKTPVTAIRGFVETLLDGALHDPAESERFLRIISRQTERLGRLIADLLSLSRVEQEVRRNRVALADGPLVEVIESAVAACEPQATRQGITIRTDVPAGSMARMDRQMLEQAVINLLQNALTYSPPAGTVEVVVREGEAESVIEVRDRGIGIPAQHLPRLFERFYRVDPARSRDLGGTGLGLAIVKHVALAHRGRVSVDSTPSHGSTFRIHLPAHKD